MMTFAMIGDVFQDMFVLSIPVLEKILRAIIVYIFLVVLLRVFGKRELLQLNQFDLVVLLSLSNTVQNSIIGNDNSVLGGMIGAFTLVGFNYLVVRFLFQHRRLDQIFEGKASVLIENGKVNKKALAKEMLTVPDLITAAHRQGFGNLREVKRCELEPGGTIYLEGKEPSMAEKRHEALIQKLNDIESLLVAK